jgi:hypothetical protein
LLLKFTVLQGYSIYLLAFFTLHSGIVNSPIGLRVWIISSTTFLAKYYWHRIPPIKVIVNITKYFRIKLGNLYDCLLCRAAEIRAYPRPTANPNANGIKTAIDSRLNVCCC